ncbi:MAG: hypothetical protein Q9203_007791, partial [Teloschistes exilis]
FATKSVIVTGSNVGLGLEAARHFARLGAARVILAVRDLRKGETAKSSIEKSIRRRTADPKGDRGTVVEVWKLDLSSYDSVKEFAARVEERVERLDVLCLNAGIATGVFKITGRDESTITTNVVSTFLLAFLLLPKLKATARKHDTRPVMTVVSSEVHARPAFPERHAPHIFATLSDPEKANMAERYFVSKLLEIFVVREMAARLAAARSPPITSSSSAPTTDLLSPNEQHHKRDSQIIINAVNPGFCRTELARDAGWYLWFMGLLLARSAEVGSRTLVAAAEEEEDGAR